MLIWAPGSGPDPGSRDRVPRVPGPGPRPLGRGPKVSMYVPMCTKHDDLIINITIDDIKNKFEEQEGKCFISNKNLTHVTDIKQRTDNVWNMSIYIDDNCNEINYDNFKLVIHMIYTIKELYKLDFLEVKSMYSSFIN